MEYPIRQQVTNLDYLNELSKGNRQFVKDMIGIFLEENPGEIAELQQSVEAKDFPAIKSQSHKLKSSVPFVGISRLLDADIAEMEDLAMRKENMPRIEELFFKVKAVCEKAREELREYV